MKYWFRTLFKFNWCFATTLLFVFVMLRNKFTTGFSEDKVPRTPVVLKMAIQFRNKKWNQSSDLFHWKYSQNQQKCCTCLTMWIFLNVVHGSQPASKEGSHRLHYCEDIFFHLSQFVTKFTFEQCLLFWLLFKLARNHAESFPVHLTKLSSFTSLK